MIYLRNIRAVVTNICTIDIGYVVVQDLRKRWLPLSFCEIGVWCIQIEGVICSCFDWIAARGQNTVWTLIRIRLYARGVLFSCTQENIV